MVIVFGFEVLSVFTEPKLSDFGLTDILGVSGSGSCCAINFINLGH